MRTRWMEVCRRGAHGCRFGLIVTGLLVFAATSTASSALAQGADQAPARIAVVNLDYVVSQSPAGKDLQKKLKDFSQEVSTEVASKREAADALRAQIAQGANSLSADKLAELQQDLEDATIAIRRYQDDKQREGQKMQESGLKTIEEQLEPVFKEVRDEGGYDLILNNVPGVIVMAGPRIDITQMVVDKLAASDS